MTLPENTTHQDYLVSKEEKQKANKHNSFLIFFTGLSGSGKSTLASNLEKALHKQSIKTCVLDGDNIRRGINKNLGFSKEDRKENIRRVAEISKLFIDSGNLVMSAFICPYKADRDLIKNTVGKENYFEVFVSTTLEECERRDVKGLYKKARNGEIKNMTGIDSPYENPVRPDITISTNETIEESVDKILIKINEKLKRKMEKKIFMQSSLPRAGSTLLQNILGQNPEFYVTPTSGVLELVFSARQSYTDSLEFKAQDSAEMEKGFKGFCKQGVQGFYNSITDKPYIVDKSRGWGIHFDFVKASGINSEPKIICMIRDPRSIYASFEQIFRKNPMNADKDLNWSTGKNTNIESRVKEHASGPPIGLAMNRLKEMIDRGIASQIHFIKYERLVSDPETIMKNLYAFLGTESFEHNFSNIEQITQEDDSVYGSNLHKVNKELKDTSTSYLKILGKEISDGVYNTYPWFYEFFKYQK